MKIVVTTRPFAHHCEEPYKILKSAGHDIITCPEGRKFTQEEYAQAITEADALIAGTEKLDANSLASAKQLKFISRIGIGLDNVDFDFCEKKKIQVAYTPDDPSLAVAELTIGFIISLARMIRPADAKIRNKAWDRIIGDQVSGKTLGLFGLGRIGKLVAPRALALGMKVIAHDIADETYKGVLMVEKEEVLKLSDFVSIHIPKRSETLNYISRRELQMMKSSAYLINTARGGIVNEEDLYNALKEGSIRSAAIDVFENEPYSGKLCELENIILTAHMGSCTVEARQAMEMGASQAVIDFFNGDELKNPATKDLQ